MSDSECDHEVFHNGQCVCIMAGPSPSVLNEIAKHASEDAGAKIDWHYAGGRAVFKTLGDLQKAADAIAKQIPQIMWQGARPDFWALDQGRPGNGA